jgi:hypothetical protein
MSTGSGRGTEGSKLFEKPDPPFFSCNNTLSGLSSRLGGGNGPAARGGLVASSADVAATSADELAPRISTGEPRESSPTISRPLVISGGKLTGNGAGGVPTGATGATRCRGEVTGLIGGVKAPRSAKNIRFGLDCSFRGLWMAGATTD